jgi:hypothetical protein
MRLALVTLAAVLGFATSARAAMYATPMLTASAAQYFVCYVSNVGTTPVTVTMELRDAAGSSLASYADPLRCVGGEVLAAGETCLKATDGGEPLRCTVEATSGKLRVDMMAVNADGSPTASVAGTKR